MQTMLDDAGWLQRGYAGPKIVALGGGHGLSATLRALRHITRQITAVVTVADDGGSSGRLRKEMQVLPPGDLRMALAALCDDTEWGLTWRDVMQYRFQSDSDLDNHALGNLLIVTLWELLGDPVAGLDWVGKLLGCHGRVLPMALEPLEIEAELCTTEGHQYRVRGQHLVAKAPGKLTNLRVIPERPLVGAATLRAIKDAQGLVFGPGSWYTSVLPHFLLPDLAEAVLASDARKILVLNLAAQKGETDGMSLAEHVEAFHQYAPNIGLDVIIVDPNSLGAQEDDLALQKIADQVGAQLLLRQVRSGSQAHIHDPLRLAAALRDGFAGYLGEVGINELGY